MSDASCGAELLERSRPTAQELVHLLIASTSGGLLRLYAVHRQILVDDEWHALHEALYRSYSDFLWDDGWTAAGDHYSVPYALLYKALADTVGLSELGMRLPSLLAGVVIPVVLPLLVRPHVEPRTTVTFAYLLAVSPLLIFFSRLARPYSAALLLSFIAVSRFFVWLSGGSRAALTVSLGCAASAAFLHASTLPLFLAPVIYTFLVSSVSASTDLPGGLPFRRRAKSSSRGPLVVLSLVLAAFLVAPYLVSPATLRRVLFYDPPSLHTLHLATELWLGTTQPILLFALLLLGAIATVGVLFRDRDRFFSYLLFIASVQVGVMLLLSPRGFKYGIVFARFCLFLLPVLLLLVSVGLDHLASLLHPSSLNRTGCLAAGMSLMLYGAGPLPQIYFFPNAFTNHCSWQCDYRTERYFNIFAPRCVPSFYLALAHLPPGTLRIVEAPWYFYWHSFAFYQRMHRQRVLVGFVDKEPAHARVGEVPTAARGILLRNMLHLSDYAELAKRRVDVVVMHKDLFSELKFPFSDLPVPMTDWIHEYRLHFGAPLYEDQHIAAYFTGTNPVKRDLMKQSVDAFKKADNDDASLVICDR